MGEAVLDSDFQSELKLISLTMFWRRSVGMWQGPLYSTISSYGKVRWGVYCVLYVGCGCPSWEARAVIVPPLQIPFHLSFKLVPLGSKGICYLLYSLVGYVAFHFDANLFSHLDEILPKRGHACGLSNSFYSKPFLQNPKRILTVGLCYRWLCKAQTSFPVVSHTVYNAALEHILDIFSWSCWENKNRGLELTWFV